MSIVQNANHSGARNEKQPKIEPRLVWSQIDRPRSFADLPTSSTAFRVWLGTLVILAIVSVLGAVSAETLGLSTGAVLVIVGFLLSVAALIYPSPKRQSAKLRIVK